MIEYDVIIVGAGAAGLFCAGKIDKKARVLVIEASDKPGKKILISGGGRCNFTNLKVSQKDYQSENPNFPKKILKTYSEKSFLSEIEESNISFYEKKLGQLFCKDSSKDILKHLLDKCTKNVEIQCNCRINSVLELKDNDFVVETNKGTFKSKAMVIATGGEAFPKLGATSWGLEFAKSLNLATRETDPALVPLKVGKELIAFCKRLAGVSQNVEVKINQKKIKDDLLFTHKGVSGPVILKASLYWKQGDRLSIDFIPGVELDLESGNLSRKISSILSEHIPGRLSSELLSLLDIDGGGQVRELAKKKRNKLIQSLKNFEFVPIDTEGYNRAEAMRGGVSCLELNSNTLESKSHKGLYFIGEVVDVTGMLGGYNFQWAWSSGYCAGIDISSKLYKGAIA